MKTKAGLTIPLTGLYIYMLSTDQAHAYLDPASGSMLVQGLLAAVAAAGVSIGIFWRRLRSFFGRKNGRDEDADDS